MTKAVHLPARHMCFFHIIHFNEKFSSNARQKCKLCVFFFSASILSYFSAALCYATQWARRWIILDYIHIYVYIFSHLFLPHSVVLCCAVYYCCRSWHLSLFACGVWFVAAVSTQSRVHSSLFRFVCVFVALYTRYCLPFCSINSWKLRWMVDSRAIGKKKI